MVQAESGPKKKIRDKLCELLDAGSKVAAVKFYYEVTLTPLLESKQFIDSMELNRNIAFGDEKLDEFLILLEERDFGGAAARLLDELPGLYLPSEVIDHTLRIATLLGIDVTQLELPHSSQLSLSQIRTAQAIIYERAELRIRQRMVQNFVRQGAIPDDAESMVDELFQSQQSSKYVRPNLSGLKFDGLDPEVARVVQLLLGPVPLEARSSSALKGASSSFEERTAAEITVDAEEFRQRWLLRTGRLAALIYGLFAICGVAMLVYSYSSIRPLTTFSIPEDLPLSEQQLQIDEWWKENMPTSWTWFLHSVSEHYSPVALEPGLPLAYEGENWTWEKKLASINVSSNEFVGRLKRCHHVLFVLYFVAVILACFHWFHRDIVSGVMMVLLGVLGIPFLTAQVWRSEFDNPFWLGPLLCPAFIALLASILDLALVTPKSDRRRELRAFWFGVFCFVVSGFFLSWAILDGNHLKPGAGLGVFGGAWLMLHHGWRYLRYK